ncbi:MAG: glycosyltransferase family 4 protein [Rhodobacteraceae bacterium]|nr:glycosyltransferase family 4 protein [Paracoccaceae bacterium]
MSFLSPSHGQSRPVVVHLIDDTTAGGVMRVLDFLTQDPVLGAHARHVLRLCPRGALGNDRIRADVIVSHLAINWRALPGLIGLRARHAACPVIHVEHSYTEAFAALNVPHKRRFHTLLRTAYALFDRVVAVSAAQGAWLSGRNLVAAERLRVIRSCVDLGEFTEVPAPARPRRVIGAIGRLSPQKGFDRLIEAFRKLPDNDVELHVHGEGSERAALEALAEGDPRVRFMGFAGDLAAVYASVDAVAMPSRWEAYGLVALEARAAGRPVLVADVDGLRDHRGAGVLLPGQGGRADLTEGLRDLLAMPDTAAEGRASAARAMADFRTGWAALLSEVCAAPAASVAAA